LLINPAEDRVIAAIDARSGRRARERETARLLETFAQLSRRSNKPSARRRIVPAAS
jgi:hypothetical protein